MPAIPFPARVALYVPVPSPRFSDPVWAPVEVGANCAVKRNSDPALRVTGRSGTPFARNGLPVIAIELMVDGPLPVLLMAPVSVDTKLTGVSGNWIVPPAGTVRESPLT